MLAHGLESYGIVVAFVSPGCMDRVGSALTLEILDPGRLTRIRDSSSGPPTLEQTLLNYLARLRLRPASMTQRLRLASGSV
jgi:hypothetical protein